MSWKYGRTIVLPVCKLTSAVRLIVLVASVALVVTGCTGMTRRIGGDDAGDLTTGLSPQDFRSVVQRMARSLIAHPAIRESGSPPRVALLQLRNHSDDYNFNGAMFLAKMQVELTKHAGGKIIFLDRANLGSIEQENQDKTEGRRQSTQFAVPFGADYFLSGELYSIPQNAGKSATYFYQFMFKLTDASTSVLVWADEYSIHKASIRGFMYD